MSPAVKEGQTRSDPVRRSFPEHHLRVRAHYPAPVRGVQVNRYPAEGPTPLDQGSVEVGMRARDRDQLACISHSRNRRVVDQANTVPQHVALGRLDQEGLLPDGEARFSTYAHKVRLEWLDNVVVVAAQAPERRPPLSLPVDGLALILADCAMRGWPHGRGVLDAATYANVVGHALLRFPTGSTHGGVRVNVTVSRLSR